VKAILDKALENKRMSFSDYAKVAHILDPAWLATNQIVVMPKTALYHHERGRKFRPTRSELSTGRFTCPACKKLLLKVRFRMGEHGYTCPRCNWCISRNDIWSPKQDEKPVVREPGDIADVNDATTEMSITMDELSPSLPLVVV
jgi:phage FluMu protein Com